MQAGLMIRGGLLRDFGSTVAVACGAGVILLHLFVPDLLAVSFYAALVIVYVGGKIVLAEVWRHRLKRMPRRPTDGLSIDVAVAFYNEEPSLIEASIRSVLAQRRVAVGRVIAVDDGSIDAGTAAHLAVSFRDDPRVIIKRLPENVGKRHALAAAFDEFISPHAALLDSDTVLDPEALSHLLELMGDDVVAVTANITALNRDDNWLSKLIDARYRNAFMVERAAQSVMGSVLCATGVLTAYPASFLREVQNEWQSQSFLNAPVQFGDDRRLTALALQRGKAIIAIEATAATQVPTDPRHFLKQQLRWSKSFLRESVLAVRDFGVFSWPGLFSFMELFFWFFYLSTIANLLLFDPVVGAWSLFIIWIAYVIAAGMFRNMSLILREPRLLVLAPFYSLLHVLILTPLRVVALLTILDTHWGTR